MFNHIAVSLKHPPRGAVLAVALAAFASISCASAAPSEKEMRATTIKRIQQADGLEAAVAMTESPPRGFTNIAVCAVDRRSRWHATSFIVRLQSKTAEHYFTMQVPAKDYAGIGRVDIQIRREEIGSLRLEVMYEAVAYGDNKPAAQSFEIDLLGRGEATRSERHAAGLECAELLQHTN